MKYVEMYIDEMKRTKEGLKIEVGELRAKLNRVKSVVETKENRWYLVQLEEHYNNCIKTLNRIVKMYSNLINLAENDELDEEEFKKIIKEIQRIHSVVIKECNRQSIKKLETIYVNVNTETIQV